MLDAIPAGTRVLITGGTGSLGTKLLEHLTQQDVQVVIFARDEKKAYDLRQRFPHVEYRLGDVRDVAAVGACLRGVDTVIHCASLKYVDVSELQPREYVLTNTLGTVNVIDSVLARGTVRRCIGISSDKAAGRIANCYGLTKRLLEKLFLEADGKSDTIFNVARYGNVLGTRGSVVPFWQQCRKQGKPLPVTDPDMTRFFFTLDDAVALLNFALDCPGGLIISQRMGAATLGDIAQVMQVAGVEIVGRRPGEKTHEELLSAEEMGRTEVYEEDYFVYNPKATVLYDEDRLAYTSDVAHRLSVLELAELLQEYME